MTKDAYYFPHYCNARNDRKIKRITKELGVEGYGIFFMLLEVLREQPEFKYPMEDIDLLADEFGTSEPKIRTVICNYKLFIVNEDESFFSPKFIEYMQPYLKMKEQRRKAGIESGKRRRAKKLNGRSTVVQRVLNENEQSKVKESKVNKIKEGVGGNEIINDPDVLNLEVEYTEVDFVNDWNELRTEHLKKPSFLKRIGGHEELVNFRELMKTYIRKDFRCAMIGLFKQRSMPNGNTTMQSNPGHFLKYFNSYFTAYHDRNTELYGKEKDLAI